MKKSQLRKIIRESIEEQLRAYDRKHTDNPCPNGLVNYHIGGGQGGNAYYCNQCQVVGSSGPPNPYIPQGYNWEHITGVDCVCCIPTEAWSCNTSNQFRGGGCYLDPDGQYATEQDCQQSCRIDPNWNRMPDNPISDF